MRICLTNVSFFRNALGPRAADLPIPLIQCPRIILLGLGFDVVLDCSIVYIPVVDIRTLFATLPGEILWGLLLRHRRQQMKQYRRREQREHKEKIANGRETRKESASVSWSDDLGGAGMAYWQATGRTTRAR